jgi:hypothetical protein
MHDGNRIGCQLVWGTFIARVLLEDTIARLVFADLVAVATRALESEGFSVR